MGLESEALQIIGEYQARQAAVTDSERKEAARRRDQIAKKSMRQMKGITFDAPNADSTGVIRAREFINKHTR